MHTYLGYTSPKNVFVIWNSNFTGTFYILFVNLKVGGIRKK